MHRRHSFITQMGAKPDSPTSTVHLGLVERHVGSVDDGIDFDIRWLRNSDSNAAADNDVRVTDLYDLACDLPQDSVGKLRQAVTIARAEPTHNEFIPPESTDNV